MTLNCPQTFKSYPSLMKITFLVDLLCLAIFSLEAIIKTKRRGLLVDGGYLRSRYHYHQTQPDQSNNQSIIAHLCRFLYNLL